MAGTGTTRKGVLRGGLGRGCAPGAAVALAGGLAVGVLTAGEPATGTSAAATGLASVIVLEEPGAGQAPEREVSELGGRVQRRLPLVGGFVAEVPAASVAALASVPGVRSATPDTALRMHDAGRAAVVPPGVGAGAAAPAAGTTAGAATATTTVGSAAETIGATALAARGLTGRGVDVALIDTGVADVAGLGGSARVVHGPDLSACRTWTSGSCPTAPGDGYGHGTHLAGIIAGAGEASPAGAASAPEEPPAGVAPGARLVSLKVADAAGDTDVSQVIEAIDWVVRHRDSDGLDIRVLTLAFGAEGVPDYRLDPLADAVEAAWAAGIVVVVAAGNDGPDADGLDSPAHDPYVLVVGGADTRGTADRADDRVADWSSRGDDRRLPDVVAPGAGVVSLRSPGSHLDTQFPQGRRGEHLFRGSGTSQAAAVVAGAAALLLEQRPELTPDQVKSLLTSTAEPLPEADVRDQGAGLVDLERASAAPVPPTVQHWEPADPADPAADLGHGWDGHGWDGHGWDGHGWDGHGWDGHGWDGHGWNGHGWNGHGWNGHGWDGHGWNGHGWNGHGWNGHGWNGHGWN